jgi:hypothetical protein
MIKSFIKTYGIITIVIALLSAIVFDAVIASLVLLWFVLGGIVIIAIIYLIATFLL